MIAVFIILNLLLFASAKVILQEDFETQNNSWQKKFNSSTGVNGTITHSNDSSSNNQAMYIDSENKGSWSFLNYRIDANLLEGSEVLLTAKIKTNAPQNAFVIVSENFTWGDGSGNREIVTTNIESDDFVEIQCKLKRNYKDSFVVISFGLDYNNTGNYMIIDDVKVEVGENLKLNTQKNIIKSNKVDSKIVKSFLKKNSDILAVVEIIAKDEKHKNQSNAKKQVDLLNEIRKKLEHSSTITRLDYEKLKSIVEDITKQKWSVDTKNLIVETNNFSKDLNGWKKVLLQRNNATLGQIELAKMNNGSNYLWINSPDMWSWSFLVKNFSAKNLKGKKIRFSCYIRANNDKGVLALAEGFEWGTSNGEILRVPVSKNLEWHRVVLEWDRKNLNEMISLAIGFDYTSKGSFMEVKDLQIESGDVLLPLNEEIKIEDSFIDSRSFAAYKEQVQPLKEMINYYSINPNIISSDDLNTLTNLNNIIDKLSNTQESRIELSQLKSLIENLNKINSNQCTIALFDASQLFNENQFWGFKNIKQKSMIMAQNEKESALLLIRNNTNYNKNFVIAKDTSSPLAKNITFRELVEVANSMDYPKELPANQALVSTGRFSTKGILVEFDSSDLASGTYDIKLKLIPFDDKLEEKEIVLNITVAPIELAKDLPVNLFLWDYFWVLEEDKLQFLIDFGVNTFHLAKLPNEDETDFSIISQAVDNLKKVSGDKKFTLMFETWIFRNSANWNDTKHSAWIKNLVKATQEANLNYDDWQLIIYDENLSDEFKMIAKKIKEIDPNIKIFSDLIPNDKQLNDFKNLVSTWTPLARNINNNASSSVVEKMKKTQIPIWCYECDSSAEQPLYNYRLMPWLVKRHNLDGLGFWTAQSNNYRGVGFGLTYVDENGKNIPSRRLLQLKDGMEDYLLLKKLEELSYNNSELKTLLDKATNEVNSTYGSTNFEEVINKYRKQLLERIK